MKNKLRILGAVLTCSIFLLSGCCSTGGLITSLEDLTTESSKEGRIKVPQYRVISVPGILPFADAGSLQFYKPKRKPSTAIGLSHGNSYIQSKFYTRQPFCLLAREDIPSSTILPVG